MPGYPEGHVFYRTLTRDLPLAVRGEGCWLFDGQGHSWLDAVGGAFVASLGHGNAQVARAIGAQAGTLAYINGTQFTHEPVERLSAELARRAPGDLSHVYFLGSGSEAVEAALKLARQYWVESGRPEKTKVLSLSPGYHGNTMLALSASGRPRYQTFFHSWLVSVPRVPAPYAVSLRVRGTERRLSGLFRRGARARDPRGGCRFGRGIHRRAGGWVVDRCVDSAAGVLAERARDLRPAPRCSGSPMKS